MLDKINLDNRRHYFVKVTDEDLVSRVRHLSNVLYVQTESPGLLIINTDRDITDATVKAYIDNLEAHSTVIDGCVYVDVDCSGHGKRKLNLVIEKDKRKIVSINYMFEIIKCNYK